ncbi:MAG: radical SAM protein [Promethearchaeota archaeon]
MRNEYLVNNRITPKYVDANTKTIYRIIGKNKHSAIKPCHWLEQRLLTGRDNRNCYKGVFGIKSHRCLQNTPSLPFCNHQCVFCWRDLENSIISSKFLVKPDEPKELVDEMLRHHRDIIKNHLPLRRYMDNYEIMIDILEYMLKNTKPQNINLISEELNISKTKVERALNLLKNQKFLIPIDLQSNRYILDNEISCCIKTREEIEILINRELTTPDEIMQAHTEALNPTHAAISLDGEPLLYPYLSGLIAEFRKRNMTTFVVTNSTLPERIERLEELPTQFYFTIAAPNERIYKKVCRPMIKNGWEKIHQTLELIDSLNCRTLVRLTAVKGLNISEEYLESYAKIIEKANPNFFEIKGFTLQAKGLDISKRLKSNLPPSEYFPDYNYLKNIAEKFEKISNFPMIYENKDSRDFLFAVNWDKDKDPAIKKL